jgi:hypothetical protein
MPLSKEALERALFNNGTGLESIPGLRPPALINQVVEYLAGWDMTQFFGRLHDAISKWEMENARGFPSEYAFIAIHPYALNIYAVNWPHDQIRVDFGMSKRPRRVLGIEIREDMHLYRTFWKLELAGKMLTNGEVLEIV